MRAREGFRRRSGIQSIWDFADPDHAGIGRVPYVRTPNLPASVIRVQKNPIAIRDGNFVLEEGQCSPSGALDRCPDRPYDPENPTATGYCGGWHRLLVPAHQSSSYAQQQDQKGLTLTQFIVEAAAGERVPFQRNGHHGWLPVQHWQKYLEANGPTPAAEDQERTPSVRQGERADRCTEDRPASEVRAEPKQRRGSRTIVLETRALHAMATIPVQRASPRIAPVIQPDPRGRCAAGVTACGGPARLYPCGWRCAAHAP